MAVQYGQPVEVPSGISGFGRRLSWGSAFAGMFAALAVQLTLTLLGMGVGLSVVSSYRTQPVAPLAIGAGIWWLITGIISFYIGGYVASRCAGTLRQIDGFLHGLTTWAVATVVAALLMGTGLAGVMGGSASMVGPYLGTRNNLAILTSEQPVNGTANLGSTTFNATIPAPADQLKMANDNLARASFFGFLGLILGCGAAIWGGVSATSPVEIRSVSSEDVRRAA